MEEKVNHPTYQEFSPSEKLSEIIMNYWKFTIPAREEPLYHVIPPDGCISLTFMLNQYLPTTMVEFSGAGFEMKEVEIPPSTTFIGIRFQPGAFNLVFPHSIEDIKFEFIDASGDEELMKLAQNMNSDFEDFEVFDQLILSRIKEDQEESRIAEVVKIILDKKGNISLQEIYKTIPLNERQFQRVFKNKVGVSAKEFSHLTRIRHALIDLVIKDGNIADIAYDRGYYDQSHFNRDLLKLSEKSPSKLKKYFQSIKMDSSKW